MGLIVITGMSGAGKSRAMIALEDSGYYCVDNIPPKLICDLVSPSPSDDATEEKKIAVVVDVRSNLMFEDFFTALDTLKKYNFPYKILFLDANDGIIINRYKETRRRHPLMNNEVTTIESAITLERQLLSKIREISDFIIDTTYTSSAQLREQVSAYIGQDHSNKMIIQCISFGFKTGLPREADLVFDVRCLPNPFYVPELREHTGIEDCIKEYVLNAPQSQELVKKLIDLLDFLIPMYTSEGKSQLVIAIGCTGGKHRSVVIAEEIAKYLQAKGHNVLTTHRDKDKARIV